MLADVPVGTVELPRGATGLGREFVNDMGVRGYSGAAPPPGRTRRYVFTVHALEIASLPVPNEITNAIARYVINARSLQNDVLTVTFAGEPQ